MFSQINLIIILCITQSLAGHFFGKIKAAVVKQIHNKAPILNKFKDRVIGGMKQHLPALNTIKDDIIQQSKNTCDIRIGSFIFNNSGCAAGCLALKYAGGVCNKGVCHCTKL